MDQTYQTLLGDLSDEEFEDLSQQSAVTVTHRSVFSTMSAQRPLMSDLMVREAYVLIYLFGLNTEYSLRHVAGDMIGGVISHEMIARLAKRARWNLATKIRNCRTAEVFFKDETRRYAPALYLKISKDLNDGLDLEPNRRKYKGMKRRGG